MLYTLVGDGISLHTWNYHAQSLLLDPRSPLRVLGVVQRSRELVA